MSGLTTEGRAERDARIAAAAQAGTSTIAIAEAEGVSDRQIRRILSAAGGSSTELRAGSPAPKVQSGSLVIDPFLLRDEAIRAHLEALATLRALAAGARQEAVRVGAARATVSTADSLLDVLERVGMAPPAPASWVSQEQWSIIWQNLVDALIDAGVEDISAFSRNLERRAGLDLGLGENAKLTGLGPRFETLEVNA